jgi:hypothetical protein
MISMQSKLDQYFIIIYCCFCVEGPTVISIYDITKGSL